MVRCVNKSYNPFDKKYYFSAVSDEIDGLEVFVCATEDEAREVGLGENCRCKITEIDETDCIIYASLKVEVNVFKEMDVFFGSLPF